MAGSGLEISAQNLLSCSNGTVNQLTLKAFHQFSDIGAYRSLPSYPGFERSKAFFTVKAGPYTLLSNFSASLTADALGLKSFVKEFCLNMGENQALTITLFPHPNSPSGSAYAFINGIEIVSMPTGLYYTQSSVPGPLVVGRTYRFHIENSTALEVVQRLNVGGSSILPSQDSGMFREWSEDSNYLIESGVLPISTNIPIKYTSIPAYVAPQKVYQTAWSMGLTQQSNQMNNFTWKLPVDLGFRYLIRLHFCELEYGIREIGQRKFCILMINKQMAEAYADLIEWSGGNGVAVYRDYVVVMEGDRMEGKRDLVIYLRPHCHGGGTKHASDPILNGLEVFKLSNPDNNLAGPNPKPQPLADAKAPKSRKLAISFEGGNAIVNGVIHCHYPGEYCCSPTMFLGRKLWQGKTSRSHPAKKLVVAFYSLRCYRQPTTLMIHSSSVVADLDRPNMGDVVGSLELALANTSELRFLTKRRGLSVLVGLKTSKLMGLCSWVVLICRLWNAPCLSRTKHLCPTKRAELTITKADQSMAFAAKDKDVKRKKGEDWERGYCWANIEILTKLHHVHLLSPMGLCTDEGEMILLYNYMENGSLGDHLFGMDSDPLPWKKRLEICIGAARGLQYLHSGSGQTIIHCNIHPNNILLDHDWVPKVSYLMVSNALVPSSMASSPGYLDPEYANWHAQEFYGWDLKGLFKSCIKGGCIDRIIDPYLMGKIAPEFRTEQLQETLEDHIQFGSEAEGAATEISFKAAVIQAYNDALFNGDGFITTDTGGMSFSTAASCHSEMSYGMRFPSGSYDYEMSCVRLDDSDYYSSNLAR
ncbi:malectin/receptor-like protein kinase family protein [Actinidia rufa]|uniref:Malectin/receptor-like protein kinase family protein n=1 Tax=Actinidia rufa TaxID=165716 RepID=A0A7J0HD60_9ERIC|nr:malectin/receptor-like protein kinase family protein [Actinidia rufa]